MTWISFICLLAVSSSALARSVQYAQYGAAPLTQASSMNLVRDVNMQPSSMNLVRDYSNQPSSMTIVRDLNTQPTILPQGFVKKTTVTIPEEERVQTEILPVQTGFNQQYSTVQTLRNPVALDQSFSKVQLKPQRTFVSPGQLLEEQKQQLRKLVEESIVLSEADILCRGKTVDTIIPLDGGRRFVICIAESKGYEQHCPRGLLYHPDSHRCERKLGPLENPCALQPCYNGGQCIQTDFTSFKCQCAPGFDGEHCELDATVCQTQLPCGQSADTRCQSFRYGAALQHICILQGGRAYGLTASQASPSPCNGVDGTFPLAFSDRGFIMCSNDLMYIESCPGGTVWDDLNKGCVWPDMQGITFEEATKTSLTGSSSFTTASRTMTPPVQYQVTETTSSFNQVPMKPKLIKEEIVSTYGRAPVPPPKLIKEEIVSTYVKPQVVQPKLIKEEIISTYGRAPVPPPKLIKEEIVSTYNQVPIRPMTQTKVLRDEETLSYDKRMQMPAQQQQFQQQQFGVPTQTFARPAVFTQGPQREFVRHHESDED